MTVLVFSHLHHERVFHARREQGKRVIVERLDSVATHAIRFRLEESHLRQDRLHREQQRNRGGSAELLLVDRGHPLDIGAVRERQPFEDLLLALVLRVEPGEVELARHVRQAPFLHPAPRVPVRDLEQREQRRAVRRQLDALHPTGRTLVVVLHVQRHLVPLGAVVEVRLHLAEHRRGPLEPALETGVVPVPAAQDLRPVQVLRRAERREKEDFGPWRGPVFRELGYDLLQRPAKANDRTVWGHAPKHRSLAGLCVVQTPVVEQVAVQIFSHLHHERVFHARREQGKRVVVERLHVRPVLLVRNWFAERNHLGQNGLNRQKQGDLDLGPSVFFLTA
ncbi:MAG: hypothetical protein KIS66_11815 [Fimbriimonadaceae bacterium]|nr:hypothetical protein [Fimbriimonadaceae bacterium]